MSKPKSVHSGVYSVQNLGTPLGKGTCKVVPVLKYAPCLEDVSVAYLSVMP